VSVTKIDDGPTLGDVVGKLFAEGIKANLYRRGLTEKESQVATAAELFGDDESSGDGGGDVKQNTAASPDRSKTLDADAQELESGDVTVENIIEKLNAIRSGKSFKEDVVRHAMDEYTQSLKKPERVALLAFLKGIAQIVTGEVSGEQALDPSDPEPSVMMKKGNAASSDSAEKPTKSQHRTVKPNVIKREGPATPASKKKGAEDTSAPVQLPITPKRK
jgi:hypothetical protein